MGTIVVDCPICGRKLRSIDDKRDTHSSQRCPGCKTWTQIDYSASAKHVSVGTK